MTPKAFPTPSTIWGGEADEDERESIVERCIGKKIEHEVLLLPSEVSEAVLYGKAVSARIARLPMIQAGNVGRHGELPEIVLVESVADPAESRRLLGCESRAGIWGASSLRQACRPVPKTGF